VTERLPARRPDGTLAERARGAVVVARDLVLPGAAASALYLMVPGQWEAFKTMLAGWGVPTLWGTFMAPLVLGVAIMGVRWAIRTFRDVDASDEP
jgi:hypothetical protein